MSGSKVHTQEDEAKIDETWGQFSGLISDIEYEIVDGITAHEFNNIIKTGNVPSTRTDEDDVAPLYSDKEIEILFYEGTVDSSRMRDLVKKKYEFLFHDIWDVINGGPNGSLIRFRNVIEMLNGLENGTFSVEERYFVEAEGAKKEQSRYTLTQEIPEETRNLFGELRGYLRQFVSDMKMYGAPGPHRERQSRIEMSREYFMKDLSESHLLRRIEAAYRDLGIIPGV